MSEQIIETVAGPGESIQGVRTSASICQISISLSKAQGKMETAKKDTANPFFKSTYADLASVWSAVREPLSDNGLAVMQFPSSEGTTVKVTTILSHASGEWLASDLKVEAKDKGAQSVGSAITYARRYSLMAVCGIAPDDDDGNAATPQNQGSTRKILERKQPVRDSAKNPEASTAKEIEDHFTGEPEQDGEAAGKRVALFLANVCGAKSKEDYTTILRYATGNDQILWDGAKMNAEIMSKVQVQVSEACQIRGVRPSELLASLKAEPVSELAGTL